MKGWRSRWSQAQQRWQQYSVREQRLLMLAAVSLMVGIVLGDLAAVAAGD